MLRGIAILSAAFAAGCESDACEAEAPSLQLDLSANGDGIGSLVVELSSSTAMKRRAFVLDGELADGTTSLAIEVEESFLGEVKIRATAHASDDGGGEALAEASGSFVIAPDGCNRFALELKARACVDSPDPNTVALYSMDGDLMDATGTHSGLSEGDTNFDTGQCGEAIRFAESPMVRGHAVVIDSPAFDLAEGSVDLWLRPASIGRPRAQGVVSRASTGEVNGGFTLYVACNGRLVARLMDVYACTEMALAPDRWSYVGVNFGAAGFELWVDGRRASWGAQTGLLGEDCETEVSCGGTTGAGLFGNDNPWILGASADDSEAGTGTPLSLPFRDGRIDALRISDARRGF